jgi:YD repeat-containing protein
MPIFPEFKITAVDAANIPLPTAGRISLFADINNSDHPPVKLSNGTLIDLAQSGGAATLAGLTDVTVASLSNGEALVYNSTSGQWENQLINGESIYTGSGSLSGDTIVTLGANSLTFDGVTIMTGGIILGDPNGSPGTFFTLPNTDGTDGQVLSTDGAGNVIWEDAAVPEPITSSIAYTYDGSDRVSTQTITDNIGTIVTTYTYKTDGSDRVDFYTVNTYGDIKTYTPTYTPTDSNMITLVNVS